MMDPPKTKPHVLIVDDDDMVRETLVDIVSNLGVTVTQARNGVECLNLALSHKFDVIIMDIIMPEKEGLETIAALRARAVPAKIIAISGGGRTKNQDLLLWARRLGADLTVQKPIDPEVLVESIRQLGVV